MDVKPGYQQTEVGVIPKDWKLESVGDHLVFKNGLNKAKVFFGSGSPIVNYMDVYQKVGLTREDIEGKVNVSAEEKRNFSVKPGDVFFTRTSETLDEIGMASALLEEVGNAVFSGFILRGRPISEDIELNFKKYCFRSEIVRKQIISTGTYTTRALTNGRNLSKVKIPLPPTKAEQEIIAEALSDADALIESLEQLLIKKRQLKQGAMQELLTGKKRLPGFNSNWEVKKLNDIAECFSGGTPSTKVAAYYNGNIPWITSGDLNKGYIWDVGGRISKEGFENSAAKMIDPDTLLVALYGATAGVTGISKIRAAINQAILAIIPHNDRSDFLYFKLSLLMNWLIATYTQGGQPNLSGDIVKNIKFPMPKLNEQEAIATMLSDMDDEIEVLERRRNKAMLIKLGMMQGLLTGRIRLV